MTRCACGANLEDIAGHDTELCAALQADIKAAVNRARDLGLPVDRAARLVGAVAAEIPAPERGHVVAAALDAWAATRG